MEKDKNLYLAGGEGEKRDDGRGGACSSRF